MIKKTIKYTDFNGDEQSEDFYFNLSKAELAELELGTKGGFGEHVQKMIDSSNGKEVIDAFKAIIGMAYGRRSEDGKRFIKSDEISQEFFSTEAYSVLFMEVLTDAEKGAEFVNGLIPADLNGPVASSLEKDAESEEVTDESEVKQPKDMSRDELMKAFMEKNQAQLGKGTFGQ